MTCCYLFSSQAESALINQQLNERLLESTDGFHDDQQQMQVCHHNKLLVLTRPLSRYQNCCMLLPLLFTMTN